MSVIWSCVHGGLRGWICISRVGKAVVVVDPTCNEVIVFSGRCHSLPRGVDVGSFVSKRRLLESSQRASARRWVEFAMAGRLNKSDNVMAKQ